MQAKELMIGDWVKVILTTSHPTETSQNVIEKYTSKKEQIVRCEHVMSNSIAYNKYSEDFKVNMSIPVVEEDVYPIPLTEEILKMNDIDEEILSYVFYDGYNFSLTDGKGSIVDVGPIWYVHQLQQALRLCGLNDIADNFKVE